MTLYETIGVIAYILLFAFFFMNAFINMSKCHYYIQKGDDQSKPFKKCFFSASIWILMAVLNLFIGITEFIKYVN